jgi:hypothetical protein
VNDYQVVAADVAWKGPFLNMWDVPTWELYAHCDQTKCDRGITLFKSYIQSTVKYNKQLLTEYEEKIIGDRHRMIKKLQLQGIPRKLRSL